VLRQTFAPNESSHQLQPGDAAVKLPPSEPPPRDEFKDALWTLVRILRSKFGVSPVHCKFYYREDPERPFEFPLEGIDAELIRRAMRRPPPDAKK